MIRIRDITDGSGSTGTLEEASGSLPAGAVVDSSDATNVRLHGYHMHTDPAIATTTTTTTTTPTPTPSQPPSYWYTQPISVIDVYLRCINKVQADALVALMQATPGITPAQIADTIGRIAVYQVGAGWVQPGWCTNKYSNGEGGS